MSEKQAKKNRKLEKKNQKAEKTEEPVVTINLTTCPIATKGLKVMIEQKTISRDIAVIGVVQGEMEEFGITYLLLWGIGGKFNACLRVPVEDIIKVWLPDNDTFDLLIANFEKERQQWEKDSRDFMDMMKPLGSGLIRPDGMNSLDLQKTKEEIDKQMGRVS